MMLLMTMPMSSIVPTTSLKINATSTKDNTSEKDLSHDGMRNKVEEGVPKQSTTGKCEQNLEQPLFLLAVVQRDEEEDEEWSSRYEEGCHDRIEPDG